MENELLEISKDFKNRIKKKKYSNRKIKKINLYSLRLYSFNR